MSFYPPLCSVGRWKLIDGSENNGTKNALAALIVPKLLLKINGSK